MNEEEFCTRDFSKKSIDITGKCERSSHNKINTLIKDGSIQKVFHGRYKKKGRG